MKIVTTYIKPPIPDRNFDWCAIDSDTYDGGAPIGYGASEGEAIGDLLTQIAEAEVKAEPGLLVREIL
jgi:hypothetical protein